MLLESHDLKSRGKRMWRVAKLDPECIARMEDALNIIYEKPPPEREPVVCVDEKPVVLHKDTRPPIPMRPGQIERRSSGAARDVCGRVFQHRPAQAIRLGPSAGSG